MKDQHNMKCFKSFAEWPVGTISGSGTSISYDLHDTREQADGVCRRLQREGFGGNGKIFPIRTWVEESEPRPAEEQPCSTCNGSGKIGGHSGQTPESLEYHSEPCPDCNQPITEESSVVRIITIKPGEYLTRGGDRVVITRRHHGDTTKWVGTRYSFYGPVVDCWSNTGRAFRDDMDHKNDIVGPYTKDSAGNSPTSNPGLQVQVSERHRECAEELLTITGHVLTSQADSFTRRFVKVLKDRYENQTPFAWSYDGVENGSPRIGFVFTTDEAEDYRKKGFSVFPLFTAVPDQSAEIKRLSVSLSNEIVNRAYFAQQCVDKDKEIERLRAVEERIKQRVQFCRSRNYFIEASSIESLLQPAKEGE